MCDSCEYNDDSTAAMESPCSSSKSFYSDTSEVQEINTFKLQKKTVRFSNKTQIFLIPSRKDQIECAINKNLTSVTKNNQIVIKKTVTFDKCVTNFPVPSRDDLKSIFRKLWYEPEEIIMMEKKVLRSLEKYVKSIKS